MPIYEYKCQNCGKTIEVFVQSSQEKINLICSHCQSHNLKKVFSAPSAVISGGLSDRQTTCCGREERCDTPPCSDGTTCRRD